MNFTKAEYTPGAHCGDKEHLQKALDYIEYWKDKDESYFDEPHRNYSEESREKIMTAGGHALAIIEDNEKNGSLGRQLALWWEHPDAMAQTACFAILALIMVVHFLLP